MPVPNLPAGIDLAAVLAAIPAAGYTVGPMDSEPHPSAAIGTLARLDPPGNNPAAAGTPVAIWLSTGPAATPPPPLVVPSFVGQKVTDQPVVDFLVANGATLTEEPVDAPDKEDGTITYQRQIGIPVTAGMTITVGVARSSDWVDVPTFTNNMIDDLWIAQWEADNGIMLNVRERQHRVFGDGVIFGQSARASSRIKRGSTIDLDVSKVRQQAQGGRVVPDPNNPGRFIPEAAAHQPSGKLPRFIRHPVKTARGQS